MNTLAYADIGERDTSSASTIASTVQQLAVSFGTSLTASLAAALFIPDRLRANASQLIGAGIHLALFALAGLDHRLHHWYSCAFGRRMVTPVSRHRSEIPTG